MFLPLNKERKLINKLEIDRISTSRAKSYAQCELQYDASYNKGLRQEGEHLSFGTIIHETLENFHADPTQDILELFDKSWTKSSLTNLEYYKDGRLMLNEYLDEPSYHANPIAKDSEGKLCLEKYFRIPLDKKGEVIGSGVIDRIDYINANTCEVIDYKTSRLPHTRGEMEEDLQLSFYNLAINEMYPQYDNVFLSLLFTRHKKLTTTRAPQDLEIVRDYLVNVFYQIKYNDDPQPRLNKYCGYCSIKGDCPLYKNLTQEQRLLFGDIPDSEKLIWEELENTKTKAKILTDRRYELENALKTQLKEADAEGVIIGGKKLYLSPQTRSFYTYDAVSKALGEQKAQELASMPKTTVDKIAKGNREARNYLDQNKVEYFQEPQIKTRNI